MTKEIFNAYVDDGWHIFALYKTTDGKGNAVKGIYATPKGWIDTSKKCKYNPNAIYAGIPPKDIVAIDYDVKKGKKGLQSFEQLQKDLNITLETQVETPSGGGHCYVRLKNLPDDKPKLKKAQIKYPDIDFQSNGSEFVVLGGQFIEGYGEYKFLDEDFEYFVNPAVDFSSLELRGERVDGEGYENLDIDEHYMTRAPLEEIEQWLNSINANTSYEIWQQVGMCLNSWDLNGEKGEELFINWSLTSPEEVELYGEDGVIAKAKEKYALSIADTPDFYKKLVTLANQSNLYNFDYLLELSETEEDLADLADKISNSTIKNEDRKILADKIASREKDLGLSARKNKASWTNKLKKQKPIVEEANEFKLPDYEITKTGIKYKNTLDNLKVFVEQYFKLKLHYDVILKRVIINDEYDISNGLTGEEAKSILFSELTKKNIGNPDTIMSKHFLAMLFSRKKNSLLDFVENLPKWDGEIDFIAKVASTIETEVATEEYTREVIKCFAIQAIAAWDGRLRTNHQLSRLDNVMTFVGKQGAGKTTWLSNLMPSFMNYYFKDGVELDPNNKDSYMEATKAGLVELGELDATNRKSDISSLKAFLSKTIDEFRAPYGATSERYARQTVFAGTVNNSDFLKDATGSRRFMVLDITKVDIPAKEDVLGMWAQAYALYLDNENWLLTDEWQKVRDEINKGYTDLGHAADLGAEIIEANNHATGGVIAMRLKAICEGFKCSLKNNRERSDLAEYLIAHGIKKYGTGSFAIKKDIFNAHRELKNGMSFDNLDDFENN